MGSTSTSGSTAATAATGADTDAGLNLRSCGAAAGRRRDPHPESGRRLASSAVRTPAGAPPRRRPGGTNNETSVPVTVWDPPAWLEAVEADDPLVVIGTVRRRFFAIRSGGRGAKAEVEAVGVGPSHPGPARARGSATRTRSTSSPERSPSRYRS